MSWGEPEPVIAGREAPSCIHDGGRRGERRYHPEKLPVKPPTHDYCVDTEWCADCGACLRETTHDLISGKIDTLWRDEVAELLYTRKGRLRIVMEALRVNGWDVPGLWRE